MLSIIPLLIIGYFFAVYKEDLFYLFEWFLTILMVVMLIYSIINVIKIKSNLKWIAISTLFFLMQLSVFCLFLGPFTQYEFFYLYYVVSILSFVIFIGSIRKASKYKFVPISFTILSIVLSLYMILLNSLWGKDLS